MERLKQATKSTTDKQLAKALGLSPTSYSNRKNANSIPFDHIISLCIARQINSDWVFTGDGAPFKDKDDVIAPVAQIDETLLGEIACALELAMGRFFGKETPLDQAERAILMGQLEAAVFNRVAFVRSEKIRREMIKERASFIANIYRLALKTKEDG